MSARLTVLIPTCDRPATLGPCLQTVLQQDLPELEILVSDNASSPETGQLVESFSDPRLRMIRTEERLGMAEHWNFAFPHITGEWVTVLGDDDGLLPGAARSFIELADQHEVDAITTVRCGYLWPGAYERIGACVTARLGGGFEVRESREWLERAVLGRVGYGDLPLIYTGGFVRRKVMEKIKEKSGRYFNSIIPDVYSGLAVASVLPRYGFAGTPFAIEGTSTASNGRKVFRASDDEIEALPLYNEGEMRFHPSLGSGSVPCIPLMVYESYLQTQELRDYEVDTDLTHQIEMALSAPKRIYRQRVIQYFRALADQHGLDFGAIQRRVRWRTLRSDLVKKLRKLMPTGMRSGGVREMRVKDGEVDDVAKASGRLGGLMRELVEGDGQPQTPGRN